jgi:hypothetical protein
MRNLFPTFLRKIRHLLQHTWSVFAVLCQFHRVHSIKRTHYLSKWKDHWLKWQEFASLLGNCITADLVRQAEQAQSALQNYGCGCFHFTRQTRI